ncbi:hypothetical protein POTOM_038611 [Populus tomentosa]|uniref:Uncharacterized protein n=1 Tax=Populus tomentosa TaxID=118781 RepID=A0A8X7YRP6_POPTO|nr:hypothetical protein POTOM_038611 [Populus tomentosa]
MDWTTNLDKISKQLNKYRHPTCWGISQKRWIMTHYCINGFQWRCSTLPSRASSTPATSTWLEKENSIIPTDQGWGVLPELLHNHELTPLIFR